MIVYVSTTNELIIEQHNNFILCAANHSATKSERNILSECAVHVNYSMADFEVSRVTKGER